MKRLGQSRKYVLMCIDAKSSITQQYTVYYDLFIVLLFIIHSIIYSIMYIIIYFGRVTFFLSLEEFFRSASLRRMGRFAWQKIQPLRFKHHEICQTPCNGVSLANIIVRPCAINTMNITSKHWDPWITLYFLILTGGVCGWFMHF